MGKNAISLQAGPSAKFPFSLAGQVLKANVVSVSKLASGHHRAEQLMRAVELSNPRMLESVLLLANLVVYNRISLKGD